MMPRDEDRFQNALKAQCREIFDVIFFMKHLPPGPYASNTAISNISNQGAPLVSLAPCENWPPASLTPAAN